jgi:hypothetical protein
MEPRYKIPDVERISWTTKTTSLRWNPIRRKAMITKSKLALIAAIAVMTVASPAFAQSYDPADGTGNALPFAYGTGAIKQRSVAVPPQNDQIAAGGSGFHAFARVPGGGRSDDDYNLATFR